MNHSFLYILLVFLLYHINMSSTSTYGMPRKDQGRFGLRVTFLRLSWPKPHPLRISGHDQPFRSNNGVLLARNSEGSVWRTFEHQTMLWCNLEMTCFSYETCITFLGSKKRTCIETNNILKNLKLVLTHYCAAYQLDYNVFVILLV